MLGAHRARRRGSGCSSWPAARAAPGSQPPRVSAPTARSCCPTSSPGWPPSPDAGPRRSASPTSAPRCSTSRPSTSPTRRYDVVLCREGLMFAVDPRRGAGEIARVLRPGGRMAVAVWGPRAENPWLGIVLDAVGEHLGMTLPPPGTPGPFSLSAEDELAAVLGDGGLVDVERPCDRALRGGAGRRWWSRTCACAGPLAQLLAGLPEEANDAIQGARVRGGRRAHGRRAGGAAGGLARRRPAQPAPG